MEPMTPEDERLLQEAVATSLFAKNLTSIRGALECFGDWFGDHDRLAESEPGPSDLPVMRHAAASFRELLEYIRKRQPASLSGSNRDFLLEYERSGIPFAADAGYPAVSEHVRRQWDCLTEWLEGQQALFDDDYALLDVALFRDVAERLGVILYRSYRLRPEAFEHRLVGHLLCNDKALEP